MNPQPSPKPRRLSVGRWGRRLLQMAGLLFVLQILFAITGMPGWLTNWLKATGCAPRETPAFVIVLGGGGIPSGSSLMRTYCAAQYGRGLTNATFVVCLPADQNPEQNSVGRMRDELVMRGIPAAQIQMETHGLNTHEEAVNVRQMLGPAAWSQPIVIVTSDYHLRRAILCFRKEGFTRVAGLNASSVGAEADPGVWAGLRYGIWNNLQSQVNVFRELAALLAAKIRGWI